MADPATLPGLMLHNARLRGQRPAMREKALGIWQTHSWHDYAEQVRLFAQGLEAMGFASGETLCVIGDNRPRLYWAQMAAMSLGGVALAVDPDAGGEQLAAILSHAEAVAVVAEDQEQVDKLLALRDRLPRLRLLVHDRGRGMRGYAIDILHAFEAVQEMGRDRGDAASFAQRVEGLDPGAAAVLVYSGAVAAGQELKGACLSHAGLVAAATRFVAAVGLREADNHLSYLPMARIEEILSGMAAGLVAGVACNCPESAETAALDRRELGPSGFTATTRGWEGMQAGLLARAKNASGLKRWTFERYHRAGLRREALRAAGAPVPMGLRIACALGEVLVYAAVRDQLGLRHARWCHAVGAPPDPDMFRFFRALGINLKRYYGPAELSGLCAVQADGEASAENVGRPCPGVEVRIAADGEVLVRGPGLFLGYHRDEAATRAAIDAEGWLHTGETGALDEGGRLALAERAGAVGRLADGTPFVPRQVESRLRLSPYILEAVAIGHDRPFACALILVDSDPLADWAGKRGLSFADTVELRQAAEIADLLLGEVRRVNADLAQPGRIRRVLLLAGEVEAGDSTAEAALRLHLGEDYARILDALYDGSQDIELQAEIASGGDRQDQGRARLSILEVS